MSVSMAFSNSSLLTIWPEPGNSFTSAFFPIIVTVSISCESAYISDDIANADKSIKKPSINLFCLMIFMICLIY